MQHAGLERLWSSGQGLTGELPERADVVVVGAGAAGLAAARRLAEDGVDVVVLEHATALGSGSSGQHTGVAWCGLGEQAWRLVKSIGPDATTALYGLGEAGVAWLNEMGLAEVKHIPWLGVDAREAEELLASAEALEALDVALTRNVEPGAGSHHLHPGLAVYGEGLVEPMRTLDRLATSLTVVGNATVVGVTMDPRGVRVDLEDQRSVTAHAVILAAGAGLAQLDPWLASCVQVVSETGLLYPAPESWQGALRLAWGWTVARATADRLMIQGCRWADPALGLGAVPGEAHPMVLERLRASAERFFGTEGAPTGWWQQTVTMGCDGLPLVGPLPGAPQVLVCTGFAGADFSLGVGCGRAVASSLLDGQPRVPVCFDPSSRLV
ncbi:MAG: NAD(P)/FAD-dependent oxidoreductase [Myxococcota bacterium]